jgi:hypothetical protein
MGLRVYDNNTWNQARALRLYNGSSWSNATRSWIYNGSTWSMNYPENPVFTVSPSISYVGTAQPVPGNGLSVNTGTVNTDPAYAPSSYSYQWTRNGAAISGATSNLYYLTTSDLGTTVTCTVTANNNRGSTPISATGGVYVFPAAPTGLTITDNTVTPNQPSFVTVTTSANSWSASWGSSSPLSYYSVSSNNGAPSNSSPTGTSTSSSSASPGSVTVFVSAVNNSTTARIAWNAVPGATSYLVQHSFGTITTTNTFLDITNQYGTLNATVTSLFNGNGAYQSTANGSILSRQSGTASGSATVPSPPGTPSPSTSSVTSNSFVVSWSPTSNTDSYQIDVGTFSGGSNILSTATTSTSRTVTGLSGLTTYYITVKAYGNAYAGYGGSGTTSVQTLEAYVTPSIGTVSLSSTNFQRYSVSGSNQGMKWGWDNVFWSGSVAEPLWMEWEIYFVSSGGSYQYYGFENYFAGQQSSPLVNGYTWSYLVYTPGDLPYSTSARYLRCRFSVYDTNYAIKSGAWSNRI